MMYNILPHFQNQFGAYLRNELHQAIITRNEEGKYYLSTGVDKSLLLLSDLTGDFSKDIEIFKQCDAYDWLNLLNTHQIFDDIGGKSIYNKYHQRN